MKTNAYIITVTTILVVGFCTTLGAGEDKETIDLAETYEGLIDDTITKCLRKAKHLDSKSPNIRRAAFILSLKAEYLKAHREDLAVYLIDVRAVPSAGIVQYHLNKKFYETFRPHEIYALLSANQISSNWRASKYSAKDLDK